MSDENRSADEALDDETLVAELVAGRRGFHQLSGMSAKRAARLRRQALESLHGVSLEALGAFSLDAERAATRHCENFIGAAQIPVGITGPLKIRGQWGQCG